MAPGSHNLDPSLTNYYKACKRVDPPSKPQQALPSSTVRWIMERMGRSTVKRVELAAHLIVLAFFFLLRVGEYTHSSGTTQTVRLRKQDVKLWRGGFIIPNDSPLPVLLTADAVTICLENQKNGNKNAVLHHTDSGDTVLNPVRAAAVLVAELRGLPLTTPLGAYNDNNNDLQQISSAEIRSAIQIGAIRDNLVAQGYSLDRIGSHSLRSGGAMHLKLAGYDNDIIQKLGRWSSNTYLVYIQTQIGQLTAGVAQRMAAVSLRFHIVG
jgi:integrase